MRMSDWSSDVCSSDLTPPSAMAPIMAWARVRSGVGHERGEAVDRVEVLLDQALDHRRRLLHAVELAHHLADRVEHDRTGLVGVAVAAGHDRTSTRLNSSH